MNAYDDAARDPQGDPQSHLDDDPVNRPETDKPDAEDDPAHDTSDEGWESEGGATPSGPATHT